MKKLLCLMGGAMLLSNVFGQSHSLDFRTLNQPFYIDNWIRRDVSLGKTINYQDSTLVLNNFQDKLIILDFWFTHCTDCIAQFPLEDSLQKLFKNEIQFILVTFDTEKDVKAFLSKWESQSGITLSFPIIVSDTALGKAFRHLYDPHYAWIFPDGKIIGQTSQHFISMQNIEGLLKEWRKRKAKYNRLHKKWKEENTEKK